MTMTSKNTQAEIVAEAKQITSEERKDAQLKNQYLISRLEEQNRSWLRRLR